MKPREYPLGKEIKNIRDQQRISLKELANMINYDRGYLSQIELGTKKPSVKLLENIAQALGVNRNLLLRHINLLKMEFSRSEVNDETRDALSGLSTTEYEEVLDYIDYIKYQREFQP